MKNVLKEMLPKNKNKGGKPNIVKSQGKLVLQRKI